jgi:hypothetical protein
VATVEASNEFLITAIAAKTRRWFGGQTVFAPADTDKNECDVD